MNSYLNAWVNSFNFEGRATRGEYWGFVLATMSVLVLMLIAAAADGSRMAYTVPVVFYLLTTPAMFSILVRRLHDAGHSGRPVFWLSVVPAVVVITANPLVYAVVAGDAPMPWLLASAYWAANFAVGVGSLYLFLLSLQQSQAGRNQYGPEVDEALFGDAGQTMERALSA